jgi:hypothetical protein
MVFPVPAKTWRYSTGRLVQLKSLPSGGIVQMLSVADLNQDGRPERLVLQDGSLEIVSGEAAVWRSPAGWQVKRARFADLNRDGIPEAELLVWRPFQPWPVDRVLPYGGRIAAYQDIQGLSCHLILIGWRRGAYRELWAGSALAQPLVDFAAADLDGDGRQELVALEGRYSDPDANHGMELSVWEWNGFGFSLLARTQTMAKDLALYLTVDGRIMVLTREE